MCRSYYMVAWLLFFLYFFAFVARPALFTHLFTAIISLCLTLNAHTDRRITMYHKSNSAAVKRLMTEYRELTLNAPEGITAGPISEDNFFEWEALIA